ncbi:MAG TPA: hypothetical protein VM848_09450 [Acidimicrobiia bacterium]|nr:hypothetical protein [Acidimicrobiia bacterium]
MPDFIAERVVEVDTAHDVEPGSQNVTFDQATERERALPITPVKSPA